MTRKPPSAYDADQLKALFAVANSEDRLLFEFFLGTGFREQEVMHCTWRNVDFKSKVITVTSKPEFGFRVKDKEERSVPVPDSLIEALTRRKSESKSLLVFPGPNGKAEWALSSNPAADRFPSRTELPGVYSQTKEVEGWKDEGHKILCNSSDLRGMGST